MYKFQKSPAGVKVMVIHDDQIEGLKAFVRGCGGAFACAIDATKLDMLPEEYRAEFAEVSTMIMVDSVVVDHGVEVFNPVLLHEEGHVALGHVVVGSPAVAMPELLKEMEADGYAADRVGAKNVRIALRALVANLFKEAKASKPESFTAEKLSNIKGKIKAEFFPRLKNLRLIEAQGK